MTTPGSISEPAWWRIGGFTAAGVILLIVAWFFHDYWEAVLVNGGTALLLFALLAWAEPRLVHLVATAQRSPRTLADAQERLARVLFDLPSHGSLDSYEIRRRVLAAVAECGLHQHPPGISSSLFTPRNGNGRVEWCVNWCTQGIWHRVAADGCPISSDLESLIGWNEPLEVHEDRVYRLCCRLLDLLSSSTAGQTGRSSRQRRFFIRRRKTSVP